MAFLLVIRTWAKANPRALLVGGVALALVLMVALVYFKGANDRQKSFEAAQERAEAAAVAVDVHADEQALAAEGAAAAVRATTAKELTDAIAKIPDTAPDPVAVRLGCQRLRQAGISVANVPACKPVGR